MLTIQYKNDSLLRWAQLFNGPANADDFVTAIAIDDKNNVYITGVSAGIGTSLDYATIKYSRKGKLEWTQRYNGTANGIDQPNDIAVDSAGNVYITGLSLCIGTNFDFATVKYAQINQGITLATLNQHKQELKKDLDIIARSVVKLVNDTVFVNTVANEIRQTGIYNVTFQTLIQKYAQLGINLKQKLSDSLASCGATLKEIQTLTNIIDSFSIGKGIVFSPTIVFLTMDTNVYDASNINWDGKTPCFVAVSLLNMEGQTIPTYQLPNNQCTVEQMLKREVANRPVWHISLSPNFPLLPENPVFLRDRLLLNFFRQMATCHCKTYYGGDTIGSPTYVICDIAGDEGKCSANEKGDCEGLCQPAFTRNLLMPCK